MNALFINLRKFRLFILCLPIYLFLFACAPTSNDFIISPQEKEEILEILKQVEPGPELLPHIDPWMISGNIAIAGSSTVFPLAERLAERFQDEGFSGSITIDSIGSGAGFERFCVTGESDIANASRPINESERNACIQIDRHPVAFKIAIDALAVVVSRENDFVNNLSLAELASVFSSAQTWSDINPTWPDQQIQRFSPGTDSGTFDYFVEAIFDKDKVPILSSANIQFSEDDNVLVQGILGSPYSVGYFGYAYFLENSDTLRLLSVGGVAASPENINSNLYPLARPLFIYSDLSIMRNNPQIAAFINYFLTYVNEEVEIVGYFPLNQITLESSMLLWLEAIQ